MLNIAFKQTSAPIDDADMLCVINAIRPVLADPYAEPVDKELALLLSKMLFRIQVLQAAVNRFVPSQKDAA